MNLSAERNLPAESNLPAERNLPEERNLPTSITTKMKVGYKKGFIVRMLTDQLSIHFCFLLL